MLPPGLSGDKLKGHFEAVVEEMLRNYTKSTMEQTDMWAWLKMVGAKEGASLKGNLRLDFQRAPPEVKDNFLAMVMPLLKSRADIGVKVLLRERMEKRSDIRVVVEDLRAVTSTEGKKVQQWRSTG